MALAVLDDDLEALAPEAFSDVTLEAFRHGVQLLGYEPHYSLGYSGGVTYYYKKERQGEVQFILAADVPFPYNPETRQLDLSVKSEAEQWVGSTRFLNLTKMRRKYKPFHASINYGGYYDS